MVKIPIQQFLQLLQSLVNIQLLLKLLVLQLQLLQHQLIEVVELLNLETLVIKAKVVELLPEVLLLKRQLPQLIDKLHLKKIEIIYNIN